MSVIVIVVVEVLEYALVMFNSYGTPTNRKAMLNTTRSDKKNLGLFIVKTPLVERITISC
jgi:hypothetical protein